jgi:hypothetical protein
MLVLIPHQVDKSDHLNMSLTIITIAANLIHQFVLKTENHKKKLKKFATNGPRKELAPEMKMPRDLVFHLSLVNLVPVWTQMTVLEKSPK